MAVFPLAHPRKRQRAVRIEPRDDRGNARAGSMAAMASDGLRKLLCGKLRHDPRNVRRGPHGGAGRRRQTFGPPGWRLDRPTGGAARGLRTPARPLWFSLWPLAPIGSAMALKDPDVEGQSPNRQPWELLGPRGPPGGWSIPSAFSIGPTWAG